MEDTNKQKSILNFFRPNSFSNTEKTLRKEINQLLAENQILKTTLNMHENIGTYFV